MDFPSWLSTIFFFVTFILVCAREYNKDQDLIGAIFWGFVAGTFWPITLSILAALYLAKRYRKQDPE